MICIEKDEFFHEVERYKPHWFVELSDGSFVYQDDGREGLEYNAWFRLKKFLKNDTRHIVGMTLRFRSHRISIPRDKDGYFFCNVARGYFKSKKTFEFFLVGYLENGKIHLKKYQTPELISVSKEIRTIEETKDCLIINA
jgi:hypothetical protein